jgi:hypothetical protein
MLFLELNTLKPLKTLEKVWEEGDFDLPLYWTQQMTIAVV